MFITDKMVSFWISFFVCLTAFNSVECGDSGCRAIPPQDANDPTTDMGLFALSDDGFQNPVNQLHIVPASTETFILIKDTHSFTHDQMPPGLTWAVVNNFGQEDVPSNLEQNLGILQEGDSRLDIYVFYTGNRDDVGVAAVFDIVQKEDGFYKTLFASETQLFRVLKFTGVTQVANVERTHGPVVMLAPKATMVYVNCNSVPATPPAPSSLATAIHLGNIQKLKDQVKLLTEKVDQQEAELTSLMTKASGGLRLESGAVRFSEMYGRWTNIFYVTRGPECTLHRCKYRSDTRVVSFKTTFDQPPEIVTTVTRIFTRKPYFKVEVKDVTSTGFKLVCSTPHDFYVNNVYVNWVAFPKA